MNMKEVYVSGIALDREREFPVVLIRSEEGEEVLPIWIGAAEATAIYTVLAGKTSERPMTHDLLKLVVEELGGEVKGIEITGIHEDTYFARIVLGRGEELFYIDARPSDAIAFALRAGSVIRVEEKMFNKYKRNLQIGRVEGENGSKGLEEIDPGEIDTGDTEGP